MAEDLLNALMTGSITFSTGFIWCVSALILGAIGGGIGGIIVGGKHMGNELAAMMGGFYGPIAALPGVLLSLIVLILV